ncbi:MAG: leucine-rich repeat domain-containing protein, partial [Treponemataceae bacterium]|nr:leucine-rich repeat domain-containing protein [Treponemataceae bacterium]
MRKTYASVMVALLAAVLLAAGCRSDDDDAPAVEYKVLGGRLVWCSGGAEEMAVPGNASSIGNNAFGNCGAIGTLTIPASVTHIMRYTFSSVRVGKIFFGGTVGEWAAMAEQDGFGDALRGTPVICSDGEWRWTAPAVPDVPVKPDEWEITDGVLVKYTGSAADVTIPNGVTAIGVGAFAGCAGITHVTIPNDVTNIGADAFKDCASLAGVTIPDSVTGIGENAFAGCDSLTNIDIPASVETVGVGAIPAETSVTYHGTAERWDELSKDGGPDDITVFITNENGTLTGYRGSAADITVPGGIMAIAGGAFAGNAELKRVVIPDGVTAIAPGAFTGSGITEIEYKGDLSAWVELVTADGIADELAGITVKCADGTWTPAHVHAHTWGETYTDDENGGHYRTCTECGEHSATEEHAWGGWHSSDEADGHCQTCSVCGAHTPTEKHDYAYTSNDVDYHTETCHVCNETRRTVHQYDGSLYTDDTNGGHYQTCTLAGCDAHSKTEEHDYGTTYTDNKDGTHYQTCSVCNGQSEPVAHTISYDNGNDSTHTQTCTANCGYSKTEAHTWDCLVYTSAAADDLIGVDLG